MISSKLNPRAAPPASADTVVRTLPADQIPDDRQLIVRRSLLHETTLTYLVNSGKLMNEARIVKQMQDYNDQIME